METIKRWLKSPFVADALERAGKSFLQGWAVGSAIFTVAADGVLRLTDIAWVEGLNVGGGMLVASILTSLLSYKRGGSGTASLVKAVEYREITESNGDIQ